MQYSSTLAKLRKTRLVLPGAALGVAFLLSACAAPVSSPRQLTIKRDSYGIPHIYATDVHGLFYGYGYAVATDRLYQMEIAKRSGWGTVAEVLGPQYFELDRTTRSSFDPASIRKQLAALSPKDLAVFEGYAAGFTRRVHEVLANPDALLPKEFTELGFQPGAWEPADIAMVWVGMILNRFFAGNAEVANLQLLNQLKTAKGPVNGQQIYKQLRWLDDPTAPTIQPQKDASLGNTMLNNSHLKPTALDYLAPLSSHAAQQHQAQRVMAMGTDAASGMPTASNAWVLAPQKTTSGHAVLYNGPQQGWFNPSIIYSVGLHGAGYDITGSTAVALPAILFGTNGSIAWGSTVGSLDTNDVYQEKLNPDDAYAYRYQGAYRPMNKRTETIKIKGEASRTVDIYSTVHGFVSAWDLANHTAYVNKRSWEGEEIETLLGWTQAAQSKSWPQFMEQAERVSTSISWFYADIAGNIGFAALGRVPDRPANQHIQFPANGDGSMEWHGYQPFSSNPKALNPEQGYIVSWNNKAMPGLRADGANFSYVDRVNELSVALSSKPKLTQDEIWAMDQDGAYADLNARYFVPWIARATANLPVTHPLQQAANILSDWNLQNRDDQHTGYYDSPAVPIMRTWLTVMARMLLQDDLPPAIFQRYADTGYPTQYDPRSAQPGSAAKLIWNALQGENAGVAQAYDFFNGAQPLSMVRAAMTEALATLEKTQGSNMTAWRTPVADMRFSAKNSLGVSWGDTEQQPVVSPYRNRGTASYRVVLDSAGVTLCSAAAPGQSGFIDPQGQPSAHYNDQLALFTQFQCKMDPLTAAQVDAQMQSRLILDY